MTIRFKLFAGFIFLIVIFVLNFYINQGLSKEVLQNSEYLNKSEMVIRNSNMLHKLIVDMQSGFRGYLLTGQVNFLDPYYEGIKSMPPLISEQKKLITFDIQDKRIDSISVLHHEWITYANALIVTRRDTLSVSGKKYRELFEKKLKAGVGKQLNDEIRVLFQEFDEHEYRVRYERRKNLQNSINETRQIDLVLIFSSITLGILACFYIIKIITERILEMVNLAEEISKGKFKVIQDTRKDELAKLSESLNRMSVTLEENFDELRRKNEELDQFAYVVSHDLKAPLRGIDNITTWMEEDHGDEMGPEIKKNLELIKGRTKRLENMINGLLDYARIGKTKVERETVDVRQLIQELFELLVPKEYEVLITGHPPVFLTDKIHLEQIFANLISNAVKYNDKQPGKITVHCADAGDNFFEFSVKDNGMGIQNDYFDKIFTIFQTLRERDAFESTGVGLAIVKRIVDEKKGEIHVESELGKGSIFKFTWPKQINK